MTFEKMIKKIELGMCYGFKVIKDETITVCTCNPLTNVWRITNDLKLAYIEPRTAFKAINIKQLAINDHNFNTPKSLKVPASITVGDGDIEINRVLGNTKTINEWCVKDLLESYYKEKGDRTTFSVSFMNENEFVQYFFGIE